MSNKTNPIILFLSLLVPLPLLAQTYGSRLIDAVTKKGIPYATVQVGGHGVIANGEGHFSFVWDKGAPPDSVHISSLGYGKQTFALDRLRDSVLMLRPKALELDGVYLFDRNLEVDDIIERMKERLPENINREPIKQRMFLRRSELTDIVHLDFGFQESTIEELDRDLMERIANSVPRSAPRYTESLFDLYQKGDRFKMDIIRAAELYDKNQVASMEELGKRMEDLFRKHIKRDSYLKIKSGLFSQKIQVDSILGTLEEQGEDGASGPKGGRVEPKGHFLESQHHVLGTLFRELFYGEDSTLDLIEKTNRYDFKLVGQREIDGAGAYVIDFFPKRGRADFKGRLYIDFEDYAVLRMDFENTGRLRNFRLLGITYRETRYKGSVRFDKLSNGRYGLRFMDLVLGRYIAVDRPLKVVEKNKHVKGRRKQNELSLELDFRMAPTEQWELVVFDRVGLAPGAFSAFREEGAQEATYMPTYDPDFWKGHNIMEPNRALREFRVKP